MRVKIYQINPERDNNRMKFMSLSDSQSPDPSIYDEVFDAEIDENELEEIYGRFNTVGHPLFRGHSLSVSDVVVANGKASICQSIGFRDVSFDTTKTHKPDNLMRVVYVEPNKAPYVAEVAHTLEAEQKAVGGYIEVVYGKKYCADSITVDEQALQRAIVRALNRFNIEDESTYLMLMKSTIGEAIGINGSSDEIDLLERRIDALNKRMLDLVTLSVQEDSDAEDYEDEFKNISMQIEQLSGRITAIRESESEDGELQVRIKEIQDTIDKRKENKDTYDDSIVRQMVECIKVYHDGRLQIILGGGYELEEYLEK